MPARLILILCFITAIDLYALQAILTIAGGGWTVLLPWFSLTVLSLLSMYLFFAFLPEKDWVGAGNWLLLHLSSP